MVPYAKTMQYIYLFIYAPTFFKKIPNEVFIFCHVPGTTVINYSRQITNIFSSNVK